MVNQLSGLSDSHHRVLFHLPKYSPIFVTDTIGKSITMLTKSSLHVSTSKSLDSKCTVFCVLRDGVTSAWLTVTLLLMLSQFESYALLLSGWEVFISSCCMFVLIAARFQLDYVSTCLL